MQRTATTGRIVRILGSASRTLNSYLPGALDGESLCGRAARCLGPDSCVCRLIDAVLGEGHCRDELRKK